MTSTDLPSALALQLSAVARHVEHDANNDVDVRLTQTFPAPITEVWSALTDPARLPLWFSPVEGDLVEGGTAKIAAMGLEARILTCDAPRSATLTWGIGGDASLLELQLEEDPAAPDTATILSLRHHVADNEHYRTYGPAATGAGWDGAFLGLALHLGEPGHDQVAELSEFPLSPEGTQFTIDCCAAWEAAHVAAGTDPAVAHEAAERTSAFYRGVA